MAYQVTIGIEIHAELKTQSKMFSTGAVSYDALPNSHVSAVDMAFPGTLPTINKAAVAAGLKVCLGLNMEIDRLLKFDRKNYFYSDLPKGFQITQQFHPLGQNGSLVLSDFSEVKITRLHLEEDTAKQLHFADKTYIDFNRAGVGLIEIVSEPVIHSAKQAVDYVSSLRQLLIYLDVSDGKMEEGSLRCDVNISLSKDVDKLGTKVEIKNLNSLNNIQRGIEFEIKRQQALLDAGVAIEQQTRRFDEASGETVRLRKKEGAVDYRYFPEPNIVPIQLSDEFVERVKREMAELPHVRLTRYLQQLSEVDARILVANKALSDFYDEVMKFSSHSQAVANLLISQLLAVGLDGYRANHIASLVDKLQTKTISSKQGKQLLGLLKDSHKSVDDLIAEHNMVQVSDDGVIIGYIEQILMEHPQVIVDFKNGKDNSIKFVMGQVMKLSKGQVNPALAMTLVKQILLEK